MAVVAAEAVQFAVVLFLMAFQTSTVAFLIRQRNDNRHRHYLSPFYLLFIMGAVLDLEAGIVLFFSLRLITVDAVVPFYQNTPFLCSFLYVMTAYNLYTQCVLNLATAVNRLWTVCTAANVGKSARITFIASKSVFLIPFAVVPILIPRMFSEARYVLGTNGRLVPSYSDKHVQQYQSTAAIVFLTTMAVMTFACELVTLVKYRILLRKTTTTITSDVRRELRLLAQALIVLTAQLLMLLLQFGVFVGSKTSTLKLQQLAMNNYVWVDDLQNVIGPVALVLVSGTVRRDYWKWLTGRKGNNIQTTAFSASVSGDTRRFNIENNRKFSNTASIPIF